MPKILVVEDDIDLNNLIRTVLESKGHTVFSSKNGREALDALDSANIELIISDIMMPQMDGWALLNDVRQANMKMTVLHGDIAEPDGRKPSGRRPEESV